MATWLDQLITAAVKGGWSTETDSWGDGGQVHTATFTRRNRDDRRKLEYVRVEFDQLERVHQVTWAPAQDGIGARSPRSDKAARALAYLAR